MYARKHRYGSQPVLVQLYYDRSRNLKARSLHTMYASVPQRAERVSGLLLRGFVKGLHNKTQRVD